MNKNIVISAAIFSFFMVNAALSNDLNFTNATKYPAQFSVSYGACSPNRDVEVWPGRTATVGAGWCLVTEISAKIYTKGQSAAPATAKPYTSSGTGYRTFKLIQNYNGSFEVIRP